VVEVREIERPEPSGDQVLVRVHAASVNRADLDGLYPRWQFVRLLYGLRRPRDKSVGLDVAGVVQTVGPDVTRFKPGDRVFGDLFEFGDGAFAEYVCVSERAFAAIPPAMSFEDAATLPHSAVLALQGLRLRDGRTFRAGDRVMIVGASGNVGPFAVQIAKHRGAEVTAVCRGSKIELVRSLGADHVIDYETTDYTRTGHRFDWVLDMDAHYPLRRWRGTLASKGVYITLGGSGFTLISGALFGLASSLAGGRWIGLALWWKPFDPDDIATILGLISAGQLRPVIDRAFPLEQVADALRWVDDGHARGKVVVTIAS
jgi:NADPH:quinone reductase-like Zn-dependent oxidoreductase